MAFIVPGSLNNTDDASSTDVNGSTVFPNTLGMIHGPDSFGRYHKYLRFDNGSGNIATAAGRPVGYDTNTIYQVTSDQSDVHTTAARARRAYAAMSRLVVTDARASWFQLSGPNLDTVRTDAGTDIIEGEIVHWETDNQVGAIALVAADGDTAILGSTVCAVGLCRDVDDASDDLAIGDLFLFNRQPL